MPGDSSDITMDLTEYYLGVLEMEYKEPRGWIQWKGTSVCMDVHCECGELSHVDGDFCYNVRCAHCGRVYECSGDIKLKLLKEDPEEPIQDTEK